MAQKGTGLRRCKFPARTWLIEVGHYRWIWDTGYANHFYHYTQNGIFKLYQMVTPVFLSAGESLKEQFHCLGIELDSIQHIILSHFHGDHIAGLKDFPHSHFICSYDGWQSIKHLRGFGALKHGFVPNLIPDNFEQNVSFYESFELCTLPKELQPFTEGYLLPHSNKQVILIPLPGHAAGHIGAFVQTEQGWILLASDAAWTPANYQRLITPSRIAHLIMADTRAYYQTLHKLHLLSQNPNIKIYLSHEGDL